MDNVLSLIIINDFISGHTKCPKCAGKLRLKKCNVAEYAGKDDSDELVGFFSAEMPHCNICNLYYIKSVDATAMQIDPSEKNHILTYDYPYDSVVQTKDNNHINTAAKIGSTKPNSIQQTQKYRTLVIEKPAETIEASNKNQSHRYANVRNQNSDSFIGRQTTIFEYSANTMSSATDIRLNANIVGERVIHKAKYGEGSIVDHIKNNNENTIFVKFDADPDIKKFTYPDCINRFLTFTNIHLNKELQRDTQLEQNNANTNNLVNRQVSIKTSSNTESTLLFTKKVDWSLLHHGFTIPQQHIASFFEIQGEKLNQNNHRVEINLQLDSRIYTAKVYWNEQTVQIRWTPNDKIAMKLRDIYSKSYKYLKKKRSSKKSSKNFDFDRTVEYLYIRYTETSGQLILVPSISNIVNTDESSKTNTDRTISTQEALSTASKDNQIVIHGWSNPASNNNNKSIEKEMIERVGNYKIPATTKLSDNTIALLEPLLTKAFYTQPIVGNVVYNQKQRNMLHGIARDTMYRARQNTHLKNFGVDNFSCDVLILETLLLLRNWSDVDAENNRGDDYACFWEYICNQYAIHYDDSFGGTDEYRFFRDAIINCLSRHKRLLVKQGQRYYTTMLLHALAPKRQFYALFEQVFAFYAKTLRFQYANGDPAFKAFAYAMKKKFEIGRAGRDDVYIKSMQSSSAIKALFTLCPEYMGSFIEQTVKNIDAIVAYTQIEKTSYLDELIYTWYQKRSSEEKSITRKERTEAIDEGVVTDFSRIRPAYKYVDNKVIITIPPIRLGEESDDKPKIALFDSSENCALYSSDLSYYGDDFCITSEKREISISGIQFDGNSIDLRIVIEFDNNRIYDSYSKLCRNAIIFDDDGTEIQKRPDNKRVNIFTTETAEIAGEESSPECTAASCGLGYVYRILLNDETHITINGIPVFPIEEKIENLNLSWSIPPTAFCKYLIEQQEYSIYQEKPILTISSSDETFEKKYHVQVDAVKYPLAKYYDKNSDTCCIELLSDGNNHCICIIETVTLNTIFLHRYIILENFYVQFEGFYYYEGFSNNGSVSINNNEESTTFHYELSERQNYMLVPDNAGTGDLKLDIPLLKCWLNDEDISNDNALIIWYEDIPMSSTLKIDVPRDYDNYVVFGSNHIYSSNVEIGNEVKSKQHSDIEAVELVLTKDDVTTEIALFEIAFKPFFITDPLVLEDKSFLWNVENNFIGNKESTFEILITHNNEELGSFNATDDNSILDIGRHVEEGVYDYIVKIKQSGFFTEQITQLEYRLVIGDPNIFAFYNRAVVVTEAIFINERIELSEPSGIIKNLRYIGQQFLNGEKLQYPCYEGCLMYKHNGELHPYATSDYVSAKGINHEQVNPIKLWVINEYTISLRTPLDDGLLVNRNWRSITDRVPDTNIYKTQVYTQANSQNKKGKYVELYINPDYYSYRIISKEEINNV